MLNISLFKNAGLLIFRFILCYLFLMFQGCKLISCGNFTGLLHHPVWFDDRTFSDIPSRINFSTTLRIYMNEKKKWKNISTLKMSRGTCFNDHFQKSNTNLFGVSDTYWINLVCKNVNRKSNLLLPKASMRLNPESMSNPPLDPVIARVRLWQCCSMLSTTVRSASRDSKWIVNRPDTGKAFWEDKEIPQIEYFCHFVVVSRWLGNINGEKKVI